VVAAVRSQHLETPGVEAGHADGVLVRLSTAVREKDPVEVTGRQFGDEPGSFAPHVVREGGLHGA